MNKPDLLLLHGALGSSAQFEPLLPLLSERYQLHLLDFEGHGGASPRERPFRIEHFAENAADYLDSRSIARSHIFGYSMGGYVALYLATIHPQLVASIATLGTKFHWDAEGAAREARLLDAKTIAEKIPHFARVLAERHTAAGWQEVLSRTAEMMLALGDRQPLGHEQFAGISHRVRIIVGDRDTTAGVEQSVAVFRALPEAELSVLPRTPHPFEKVAPDRLAQLLIEFFH